MPHDKRSLGRLRVRIERISNQLDGVRDPFERSLWRKHIQHLRAQLAAGLRQVGGRAALQDRITGQCRRA